ncbi:MAG: hypothetical protein JNM67_13025 [Bacteroidetes bacterium]|nr:hypothetical protein [Bacteroidota bacterium]
MKEADQQSLILDLKQRLPFSTGADRIQIAEAITASGIELDSLFGLLLTDKRTALRFLWLISDIGIKEKQYLHKALPALWVYIRQHCPEHLLSFASYWHIAGVPEELESEAIPKLFEWIASSEVNVTMKSRSIFVLQHLVSKYPDLQQEFHTLLELQADRYSADFERRVRKIIVESSR